VIQCCISQIVRRVCRAITELLTFFFRTDLSELVYFSKSIHAGFLQQPPC
jgi:hypothetical protein